VSIHEPEVVVVGAGLACLACALRQYPNGAPTGASL
jgi:hypothetical protein